MARLPSYLLHRQRMPLEQPTDHVGGRQGLRSVHPLETVFSASALIRTLTRLSSVVCCTVLLFPRHKPISADRHVTAKKSTAWPIPGRGEAWRISPGQWRRRPWPALWSG
jgi:hypothetical protein